MNINKNIAYFQNLTHNTDCKLVAVSKTKSDSEILEAYSAGQRVFGENRVQEVEEKYHRLPKDIQWHMIGHLQRNKVKLIAPFIAMIHSVDSIKLAEEINKQAEKSKRIIPVLLQVHIAREQTKFGFSPEELLTLVNSGAFDGLTSISICGLMGMATFTDNKTQIREEFKRLKELFDSVKNTNPLGNHFKEISMGMTNDYEIAMEEGSTLIRVGSAIFGERN